MRKKVFGRKFKRTKNQRAGLFRSLMHAMIIHGKIKTTEAKAKSIKGSLEKLVTKAKNKGEEARNDLMRDLVQHEMVDKMINDIAPRFKTRPGGYTRILKAGNRIKDNSPIVILEWVEQAVVVGEVVGVDKANKKAEKKAAKKTAKKAKKAETIKKETKEVKKDKKVKETKKK